MVLANIHEQLKRSHYRDSGLRLTREQVHELFQRDAYEELLAACRTAVEWVNRFGEHAPIQFGGEAELYDRLRVAIAKAEASQ